MKVRIDAEQLMRSTPGFACEVLEERSLLLI
jgi:hypothetical protein